MASEVANAIARIQDIVGALTTVTFKSYPDFPIENADPFPMAITYESAGDFFCVGKTVYIFPVIRTEMHFSRVNLKNAYTNIYNVSIEFAERLAGDPTLNATVETIIMTDAQRVSFLSRPFDWGSVKSEALIFEIPIKLLKAPITP